ncbi:hypothetical protein [Saccharothrix coeruleofusca]|uniref:hypothetical protein n=1 Tax=Saccharothrix coeruleofusca TaxID=33919 RepID=UPI001AE448D8|nr:hypothetical protein [Saccharothrix coeruleofusca]
MTDSPCVTISGRVVKIAVAGVFALVVFGVVVPSVRAGGWAVSGTAVSSALLAVVLVAALLGTVDEHRPRISGRRSWLALGAVCAAGAVAGIGSALLERTTGQVWPRYAVLALLVVLLVVHFLHGRGVTSGRARR